MVYVKPFGYRVVHRTFETFNLFTCTWTHFTTHHCCLPHCHSFLQSLSCCVPEAYNRRCNNTTQIYHCHNSYVSLKRERVSLEFFQQNLRLSNKNIIFSFFQLVVNYFQTINLFFCVWESSHISSSLSTTLSGFFIFHASFILAKFVLLCSGNVQSSL